jgi:hypothetical protein
MNNNIETMKNIKECPNEETNEETMNELPEYSDDEDFRKMMNEAIMNKLNNQTDEPKKTKKKKCQMLYSTPIIKTSKQMQLGEFMKTTQTETFVSQRKYMKQNTGIKRQFNPRMPPYLLVKTFTKKTNTLDENDFPQL